MSGDCVFSYSDETSIDIDLGGHLISEAVIHKTKINGATAFQEYQCKILSRHRSSPLLTSFVWCFMKYHCVLDGRAMIGPRAFGRHIFFGFAVGFYGIGGSRATSRQAVIEVCTTEKCLQISRCHVLPCQYGAITCYLPMIAQLPIVIWQLLCKMDGNQVGAQSVWYL